MFQIPLDCIYIQWLEFLIYLGVYTYTYLYTWKLPSDCIFLDAALFYPSLFLTGIMFYLSGKLIASQLLFIFLS